MVVWISSLGIMAAHFSQRWVYHAFVSRGWYYINNYHTKYLGTALPNITLPNHPTNYTNTGTAMFYILANSQS